MKPAIKVLIVDDSAVVRQVLSAILSESAQLQVIGCAADPILAQQQMALEWPDVIVLDLEMPRMDGLTFLRQIMQQRPTPVLICSTLSEHGAEVTLQAMAAGAVGYVTKPKLGLRDFLSDSAAELIRHVLQAAQTRPRRMSGATTMPPVPMCAPALARTSDKVVAIGASTGGTQALELLLTGLPAVCPGIVIVQHMPPTFTTMFAARLNSLCAVDVREANDGDRVLVGRVLVAPGGKHMRLARSGAYYLVEVLDGPPINLHKPSVDVLFKSVAGAAGGNALGIILTGMGDDGARGLRDMREAGARTLSQDEDSCVVFGMPREAQRLGAVQHIVRLDQMAKEIQKFGLA